MKKNDSEFSSISSAMNHLKVTKCQYAAETITTVIDSKKKKKKFSHHIRCYQFLSESNTYSDAENINFIFCILFVVCMLCAPP